MKRAIGADAVRCEMALGHSGRAADLIPALSKQFSDDAEVLHLSGHVYSELATQAPEGLLETTPSY